MKILFLLLSLVGATAFSQTIVDVTGLGRQKLAVEIQVADAMFKKTLAKNLELSGLFLVRSPGAIRVTGSSGAVVAANARTSLPFSTTFADAKSARMAARELADAMCETFASQKGFAQDPILFLNRARATKGNVTIPAELCVAYPDGQDIRQLTSDGKLIIFQRWMPDRERVLYISDKGGATQIWEMNLATGTRKVRWSFKGTPTGIAVSPDGTRVAAILSFQGNPELYVLEAKTGAWKRLTKTDYDVEGQPAWSPDGTKIAFVRGVNSQQIWVHDLATGKERRLTSKGRKNVDPDWGANGQIAYIAGNQVAVMDAQKGDASARFVTEAANWEHPSWSRDGRHLAANRDKALFLIDTFEDGDKPRQLFFANGNWVAPCWARD